MAAIADLQAEAVYAAESCVWWGRRFKGFGALDEAQVYVDEVLASPLWQKRKPSLTEVRVVSPQSWALRGMHLPKTGQAMAIYHAGMAYIALPKEALTERYVLHELAHFVAEREDEETHSPRFARTYLGLVGVFMGLSVARTLREGYAAHKVEWRLCSSPNPA